MNHENLLKRVGNSYVYFPFLCGAFVLGLTLLFYKISIVRFVLFWCLRLLFIS